VKAFAPGKLVLTGAYAVLTGAPAIVVATSRGVIADGARTSAPTPEVRAAIGNAPAPHVDASALFVGDRKLGLGASAAILVASLAVREAARGADLADPQVRRMLFERAREAHAASQSGGSGVDVASSVYGGVLEYVPGDPRIRALPAHTELTVFACGASARTSELRAHVDRLADTSPSVHHACIDELTVIAELAAKAVRAGEREPFIAAIRRAARALARLGDAAGVAIVPEGFEALEELAAAEGAAFCVSGAGGGDVATYVGSKRPGPAFVERALALGLFEIDVALDEKGVRSVSQSAASLGDAATAGMASTS